MRNRVRFVALNGRKAAAFSFAVMNIEGIVVAPSLSACRKMSRVGGLVAEKLLVIPIVYTDCSKEVLRLLDGLYRAGSIMSFQF